MSRPSTPVSPNPSRSPSRYPNAFAYIATALEWLFESKPGDRKYLTC